MRLGIYHLIDVLIKIDWGVLGYVEIVKIFRKINKLVFIQAQTRREKTFIQTREGVQNITLYVICTFMLLYYF